MITSTANDTVKRLSQLKERRGRLQQGRYLLEGVRLVEEALAQSPEMIVVAPDLLQATARGRALVQRLQHDDTASTIVEVTPGVLARIADTETPSGVVAVLARHPVALDDVPATRGFVVVLDGVSDPGNAGAIMRTAAAAGVDGVVALAGGVDLYAPKVVRAAMGAHLRLSLVVDCALSTLEMWLPSRGQALVASANGDTTLYDARLNLAQPTVLVIGGEAYGATGAWGLPGVRPVAIPMPGAMESLNAAAAAAVIIFEAVRQRHRS